MTLRTTKGLVEAIAATDFVMVDIASSDPLDRNYCFLVDEPFERSEQGVLERLSLYVVLDSDDVFIERSHLASPTSTYSRICKSKDGM